MKIQNIPTTYQAVEEWAEVQKTRETLAMFLDFEESTF